MDEISRHVHVTTTVRMNFSNNSHTRVASAEPGERLALLQVRGFAPHSAQWLMCLHGGLSPLSLLGPQPGLFSVYLFVNVRLSEKPKVQCLSYSEEGLG